MSSDEDEGYSNPWNEYQHNHAGLGWSRAEMSENYQDYKANGCQSSESEDERETYNNSHDYGHGNGRNSSSDDEKSYSNPWNEYQHNHAGLGWSRAEMSENYQEYKANDYQSPESEDERETYNDSHDYGYDKGRDSSSDAEKSYSNPWNEYQHNHVDQGWSRSEMSEHYQEYKANGYQSPESENERETYNNSYDYGYGKGRDLSSHNEKSYSNQWNKYQHDHADRGWSRSKMSENYQKYKVNGYQASESEDERETRYNSYNYGHNNTKDSPSDGRKSYSNPWNQYQHQNAGQGWTRPKMSENYQKYKSNKYQASKSEDERKTHNNSYNYGYNNTKDSPSDGRKSYSNPWNQYQHQNAGRGWSRSNMSRHYQNERRQPPTSDTTVTTNPNNTNKKTVGHSIHNWQANRAGTKLSEDDHSKQENSRYSSTQYSTFYNRGMKSTYRGSHHNSSDSCFRNRGGLSAADHQSRIMPSDSRKSSVYDYNNNILKTNQTQPQSKEKKHPKLTWQQYQHLYKGQGKTSKELADMYHAFRVQEQSFKWQPNYQLEFNSNGQLIINTAAGQEAMKTGLFDEQGNLRHRPDQIPWVVFKSKMQQMNIDPKKASAMRNNHTGSNELNASHLKTSNYRQHIPQHESPQRRPRDADHILEPQICVSHLRQVKMNHDDFQIFIEELNSKYNIKSTGQIENRQVKRNANIGIAINKPFLNVETFKQEKLQASQARLMAQKCEARGAHQAAQVLNAIAEKCTQLNSIHQALNQMKINTTQGKLTKQSDVNSLIQQIITYERKYGTLEFRGGNVTQQHLQIFDQAHKQQSQQ